MKPSPDILESEMASTSANGHSSLASTNGHSSLAETNGHSSSSILNDGETKTVNNKKSKKRKRTKETEVYEDPYEVECIREHMVKDRKIYYYVKWEGWPDSENTWEPYENVRECQETIVDYFQKKAYPNLEAMNFKTNFNALKHSIEQSISQIDLVDSAKFYFTEGGHRIPELGEDELDKAIEFLSRIPPFARETHLLADVKNAFINHKLVKLRAKQLAALKLWESEINTICADPAPIKVFNSVDLDGPPLDFLFVNKYIPGSDVIIPEDPPIGCECTTCLTSKCCSQQSGRSAYNKKRLLKVPRGTPIYECNDRCLCPASCENRVVQKGRTFPVAIFKTTGCGWGLKTLEKIPKGAFVVECVGEVIKNEEAERRGELYDRNGATYLFDLDFNTKESHPYTVDAALYGNVSHFINHSCNPNMEVFAVWVNCLDPDIPRLGLFATRNIKENEELTFDYLCQPMKDAKTEKRSNVITYCKCGAKNCRKYLF